MGRRAPRAWVPHWLIVLTGLSLLFVATVGVVPHGDEDQSCLACKARHQPIEKIASVHVLVAPRSKVSLAPSEDVRVLRPFAADSTAPRGPPAV